MYKANLYGVEGWLKDLRSENVRPYAVAEPLYDMDVLNEILSIFKQAGWRIVVTTWLAKGGSKEYNNNTRLTKIEWLKKYNFPFDEFHGVKYGTTKANCTRNLGGFQVLIDDNDKIREGWSLGETIDAKENILEKLIDILDMGFNLK